jgi:RNA polymerase sigma-70 factor (ECF subfamily)
VRPDDELVRAVRDGDRQALGLLFEGHRDFVFRVGLGLTGRRDEAAEIVQETFLALLERAPSIDPDRGRITTWLFEVARRRAADRVRRRRLEVARPTWMRGRNPASPDPAILEAQRKDALHRAVAELPVRSREVFILGVGLGLSVDETSRLLGCAPGAVRTALHDASRRLRARLADTGKGGSDVRDFSPSLE